MWMSRDQHQLFNVVQVWNVATDWNVMIRHIYPGNYVDAADNDNYNDGDDDDDDE